MTWIRQGECKAECKGDCCWRIGVWFSLTEDSKPFLKLLQTRGLRIGGGDGKALVEFPQECQYLTRSGKCRLITNRHDKTLPRRPEFCSEWPTEPSQLILHPDCGYSFVEEPKE